MTQVGRRKRSRLSIIYSILAAIESNGGDMNATRLATVTGLAYDRLVSIIEELSNKGLVQVRIEDKNKIVYITREGYKLLSRLRDVKRLLEDFGIEI